MCLGLFSELLEPDGTSVWTSGTQIRKCWEMMIEYDKIQTVMQHQMRNRNMRGKSRNTSLNTEAAQIDGKVQMCLRSNLNSHRFNTR